MSWVKRNLKFLAGGIVAVLLLGVGGYYLYSKWALNNQKLDELNKAYSELERIGKENPNPGNEHVDNTQNARAHEQDVRAIIAKTYAYLKPVRPIPDTRPVTSESFASGLSVTLRDLENAATKASVHTLPRYSYSFEVQRPLYRFPPGSLEPMAGQLGDIKAICGVLFDAKVNSLENIKRERVSEDDQKGSPGDYLDGVSSVTNDLAVLVPYEVSFHCFSGELAAVLEGFANQPHGIIVKMINVESSTSAASGAPENAGGTPFVPMAPNPAQPYGAQPYGAQPYGAQPYGAQPAAGTAPATTTLKGGLQVLIDERPIKVTLVLNVIRLLPKK